MSLIKGRYKSAEIAEDGSAVKVRLQNGAVIRVETDDLVAFIGDMVNAMTAAKIAQTARPDGVPTRFSPTPPVVHATETNLNWFQETDAFTLEASDKMGRKVVAVLKDIHLRYIVSVYEETRSLGPGHELH